MTAFLKISTLTLKLILLWPTPPFNQKQWRGENELVDDSRWAGFDVPPTGNANYAWIMHMIAKLSEHGTAGFVLANGSMSTNTSGEGEIRKKIIEQDLVDCMIALPGQLFYTTQIPVCLWFISKNKKATLPSHSQPSNHSREGGNPGFRDRQGETLFIDARDMGSMVSRVNKELTNDDIAHIAQTYHAWRSPACHPRDPNSHPREGGDPKTYQDIAGYCKSATLDEIKANDYVLTPGRYVGAADIEDDGIAFESKMAELSQTLVKQMKEGEALDKAIRQNLKELAYGE